MTNDLLGVRPSLPQDRYARLVALLEAFEEASRGRRAAREAEALLGLLAGIVDPDIRLHRLAEHLRDRPRNEAAWTLAWLHDRVAAGDPRAQSVCLGLLDRAALSRFLDVRRIAEVYGFLSARGHPAAGLLAVGRYAARDEATPPAEPLGYRISLARRPLRHVIARLLTDPDARVVETLLGNPQVTEADVVSLAAARRAIPEALEVIARDQRWIGRYSVRLALAHNPVTPLRVVLGLLPYLLQPDLRELALTASRPDVRSRAEALRDTRKV